MALVHEWKMMRKSAIYLCLACIVGFTSTTPASASLFNNANSVEYYDSEAAPCTYASAAQSGSNSDYRGRDILTESQLATIKKYQPVYETAAKSAGIPWQILATVHLRETGLGLTNPTNGQGIYQDFARLYSVDVNGKPTPGEDYPSGPVSQRVFEIQTNNAAKFITSKTKKDLTSGDDAAVKDVFFAYNGRATSYVQQAMQLGFTENEGYEGSPYVMNKFDERRDPEYAKSGTWGQIKSDGGSIQYPANADYGAYVIFLSLGGSVGAGSTNCSGKSYAGTCTPHKAIDDLGAKQHEELFGKFEDQSEWEPVGTFMDFRFATNSAASGAMINKRVVGCLRAVEAELKARGSKYKVWSFMCSRLGEARPDFYHGYAAACDINPSNGGKGNGCGFCLGWGSNNHDMPMDWVEIFEKYGWEWGGRWKNGTNGDWMHFQYNGPAESGGSTP